MFSRIVGPPSGGLQPPNWRNQLNYLEPLQLPLLAIGAGVKRKAPADPETGRLLNGWQTTAHSIEQIRSAHPQVIAAGTRTGSDAGGLLAFDVDGETALSWLLEHGCDPEEITTWQVHRTTDPARLKVLFRLTADQQQRLGQVRRKVGTGTGEAVELFHDGSAQVIVIGEHPTSGGHYFWPDHLGPESLTTIPERWFAAAQSIAFQQAPTQSKTNSRTRRGDWLPLSACPICGRNTSGFCAQHVDRKTIRCFHGSTFSPPTGLKRGEEITDTQGTIWAFSKEEQQKDGHIFSTFVAPNPDKKQKPATTVTYINKKEEPVRTSNYSRPIRLETHTVMERLEAGELGQLRLNVRSGDVHAGDQVLTANEIGRAYLRLSSASEKWPKDTTCDAITEIASQNRFDPVEQFLNSNNTEPLPMEQWNRLDQHLLGIDDPIAAAFLPRYLVSAVARVFQPGASVRQVPVLVGPQWRGKSALGRILFGNYWVEGIGDLGKDDLLKCHTAWGVELAELDGVTRRSDQEKLKAFLTERTDTYRKPYDRAPERHDRRFVFWGTSNAAPLRDSTGSTRFVTIAIPDRMLPLEWAQQNRDALWSRAVEQYRAGIQWDVCSESERLAIAERNEDFTEHDPWFDSVRLHLERRRMEGMLPAQIPAVLDSLGVSAERQGNRESKRVRQIAEALGWTWARKRVNGKQLKGLWPPVPTAESTAVPTASSVPTKSPAESTAVPTESTSVPTESTSVPTAESTEEPSHSNGLAPLCPPSPPKTKELDKREKDRRTPPSEGSLRGLEAVEEKSSFRGARGAQGHHQTLSPPDEALLKHLVEEVMNSKENVHPHTLAIKLDPDGTKGINGAKVKDWLNLPEVQKAFEEEVF